MKTNRRDFLKWMAASAAGFALTWGGAVKVETVEAEPRLTGDEMRAAFTDAMIESCEDRSGLRDQWVRLSTAHEPLGLWDGVCDHDDIPDGVSSCKLDLHIGYEDGHSSPFGGRLEIQKPDGSWETLGAVVTFG